MKKILSLMSLAMSAICLSAQTSTDAHILVEEGRIWEIASILLSNTPQEDKNGYYQDIHGKWGKGSVCSYTIEGDTIIGGTKYKQLRKGDAYLGALRQEGGKVYRIGDYDKHESLLFDFDLKEGEVMKTEQDGELQEIKIDKIDEVCINGIQRKRYFIGSAEEGVYPAFGYYDIWIEGIGGSYGPLDAIWWRCDGLNRNITISCKQSGIEIFKNECFYTNIESPTAISHPQQDYRPFVEEGKVWTLESKVQFSTDDFYVDTTKYEIKGDSLIGDVTYKKLLLDGKCRYLLREEGKRVYMFFYDEEFLLYDFGLGLGDVLEEKLHELGDYQVSRKFSVNASDKTLRCMELTGLAEANDVNYWIEGVGGLEGPVWPFYSTRDGAFLTLLSCEVNGEVLYQYGDFTTTGISHIAYPASSTLYDLQGRKIEAKPGKGIYIKDGKLIINK